MKKVDFFEIFRKILIFEKTMFSPDVPYHLRMLFPTHHDEKTGFGGGIMAQKKVCFSNKYFS